MRRILVRSCCALLALTLSACTRWDPDEHQLMQKAAEYYGARRMNAAAIELRNVLQANPANGEARYLLAGINLSYGDYATAEKEYKHALQAGWNREQTIAGLARCYLGEGQFQQLLDNIHAEDNWDPSARADILAMRAIAEAGLGHVDQSRVLLTRAIALVPDSLPVLKARVQLAMLAGKQDDARQLLDQAMKKFGDNQELLVLDADQYVASGHPELARPVYQKAIAMDKPGFITVFGRKARLRMAQSLIITGDLDAASRLLQPLVRRDPGDPFTNYLEGLIAFLQAQYQHAEELLLKVLKVAPDHNPTRLLFGVVNFAERNYEQAAYFLGKYVDAVPDNLPARKLLARSDILLGRPEQASAVLQGVAAGKTSDAELLTLAGLSELERGERIAGITGLEKALEVNPGDRSIRMALARAYIENGDTALAVQQLQSLLAEGGEQQQTAVLLVIAHLRAGEFSEAVNAVLGMVHDHPDNALYEALAGNVFMTSGDRDEARKHLERALQLKPDLPPAVLTLAQLDELEGKLDTAAELYRQLVKRDLKSALPMLALARLAERRHDEQSMVEWLERALDYAPRDVKPPLLLAEYYLRTREPDKAGPLADQAIELAPRDPRVLLVAARVRLAQQQYSQAEKMLRQLLDIDAGSVPAHTLLGEVYMRMKHLHAARTELQVALKADPSNVNALALQVALEIGDHDYSRAMEYSNRLQQTFPELYLGYELAGDTLVSENMLAEAAQEYQMAWQRLPSESLVVKRADVAARSGDIATATTILEGWLQGHPEAVPVRQAYAGILQQTGRTAPAINEYQAILKTEPDNVVVLNNLAVLYQASDPVKALSLAERAWRAAPANPGVQDTYGWLLVGQNQVERGLSLLEKADQALAGNPAVRYHHAVAVFRSGDKVRGKAMLQALLDSGRDFPGRKDAESLLHGN